MSDLHECLKKRKITEAKSKLDALVNAFQEANGAFTNVLMLEKRLIADMGKAKSEFPDAKAFDQMYLGAAAIVRDLEALRKRHDALLNTKAAKDALGE